MKIAEQRVGYAVLRQNSQGYINAFKTKYVNRIDCSRTNTLYLKFTTVTLKSCTQILKGFLETLSLLATSEESNLDLVPTAPYGTDIALSEVATQTNSLAIQSSSCQTEILAVEGVKEETFSTPKGGKNEPKFSPPITRSKRK